MGIGSYVGTCSFCTFILYVFKEHLQQLHVSHSIYILTNLLLIIDKIANLQFNHSLHAITSVQHQLLHIKYEQEALHSSPCHPKKPCFLQKSGFDNFIALTLHLFEVTFKS